MKPLAQTDLPSSPSPAAAPNIAAALDLLWTRFQPEIWNRVELLAIAAAACAANELTAAQREAAHDAAHKLAGTLGTFNLAHGTDLAREFELLTSGEDAPDSATVERMVSIAVELRTIIDSRK
ncbi:MAG TPA: Hpt domain-containing protein [Terracidiphilus sp.]|nr:Hpt domain-containing protein [Terracidiphilus sp.]